MSTGTSIPPPPLLSTPSSLHPLLNTLINLPTNPPPLYIDLEGINLGRNGSISILQLHVLPTSQTYLIDIHTLGALAFSTTATPGGPSLRSILQDAAIPKAFFDVRNDSDALFAHFNIALAGVVDIQLMELATRRGSKKFLCGLAKCIERDAGLSWAETAEWKRVKERGVELFAPERGGSYEVFNVRPLPEELGRYCVQDVQVLPRLWRVYEGKLPRQWRARVEREARKRVVDSWSEGFAGKRGHGALGPW